jgi:hypothetical protein
MGHFYIRRGQSEVVEGPLHADQLRAMAIQGDLRMKDLISQDQQQWVQAGTVSGLIFGFGGLTSGGAAGR